MSSAYDIHLESQQVKMWIMWRNIYSKTEEALSMSLLNMLGGILFESVHIILKDSPRGGVQGI